MKHLKIQFARLCALAVISFMCCCGDKSFAITIPRSLHCAVLCVANWPIWYLQLSRHEPICNTCIFQLTTATANPGLAHASTTSEAFCSKMQLSWTLVKFNIICFYCKSLIFWRYFCKGDIVWSWVWTNFRAILLQPTDVNLELHSSTSDSFLQNMRVTQTNRVLWFVLFNIILTVPTHHGKSRIFSWIFPAKKVLENP